MIVPSDTIKRFYAKIDKSNPNGCWEWTASKNASGYGLMYIKGRKYRAHRISCYIHNLGLKPRLVVLHTCDNPCCVNPDHLRPGTQQENVQDMIAKGRGVLVQRGERNMSSKLRRMDIKPIRKSSESNRQLAQRYGVNPSTISRIKCGLIWAHIN